MIKRDDEGLTMNNYDEGEVNSGWLNKRKALIKGIGISLLANSFAAAYIADFQFRVGNPKLLGLLLVCLGMVVIATVRWRNPVNKRLNILKQGVLQLKGFRLSLLLTTLIQAYVLARSFGIVLDGYRGSGVTGNAIISVVVAVLAEALFFWVGMVAVYTTSVQLGIKHRIAGIIAGWIPIVNLVYLSKIIRLADDEVSFEEGRIALDRERSAMQVCKTKYPILMVHGVFFRDFRFLNYWGRIPAALKTNGAEIFYGEQQSAISVEEAGAEIAAKIKGIVEATGCQKVNIIAHSKGGLDCRAAIARYGAAPYVASLTTINTPHRGCIFAEYLLHKAPESMRQNIAAAYNKALKAVGDANPDFIGAVSDLTKSACDSFNEVTPDAEGILYESVMSYCKKAGGGKFPLNVSYPVVKHFDGKNDGLVAVDSARWGSSFTLVEPTVSRGISHGDVTDLNRENVRGFDVREFYVKLVSGLKQRGF